MYKNFTNSVIDDLRNKLLITILLIPTLTFAADDYIIGQYEYVHKLTIIRNKVSAQVTGEGKYVAGFVEKFYDNLSDNYRNDPKLRQYVLRYIELAEKTDTMGFNLKDPRLLNAFNDTVEGY